MSRSQRLAFAAIAAVIAIVAVVVFASGGDDEETAATTPTPTATATTTAEPDAEATATEEPEEAEPAGTRVEVKGGEVVGGVQEIRAKEGEDIVFTVAADVADEVHVHGYDVTKDVAPGKPAKFDIPAKITGIFEVELEGAGLQVVSLRVEQ